MDGSFSLPGAARRRRWPEGQLSPRAGFVPYVPQPISINPVGLGFPPPVGWYRPGGSAFSSPGCWSCRDVEGFLADGWELIPSGCGGTSALARGATLAARWLHEPQPISNHPVRLEISIPVRRYRPRRSAFSTACWSCRDMEGFLTRGWELIPSGCGGTSALARRATLTARRLYAI